MVKLLTLLAVLAATAQAASEYTFRLEFSKNDIYEGEQIAANFVLYAEEDALDVEVAKFPEFRGYWSENISLRQGPVPLLRDLPAGLFRKTVVGTYLITSMIGKRDIGIEPMKLVVKKLFGPGRAEPEKLLLSDIQPLNVKPLPPLPADLPKDLYRGAVGLFTFTVETPTVRFQKDEPVTLRFLVQGEGNFAELNELPLTLPQNVEVISRRAYGQGAGQYASKTFEVTAIPHADRDFEIGNVAFAFFNPMTGRYEVRTAAPVVFRFEAKAVTERETEKPLELGTPFASWSAARPLSRSPFFWLAHLFVAAAAGAVVAQESRRRSRARYLASPAYRRSLRFAEAKEEWRAGRLDGFLRIADDLAYDVLKEKAALRAGLTRSQAVREARERVPSDLVAHAEKIFTAHERYSYSGSASPEAAPEEWVASLESILDRGVA